jgi:hypothetical protein
MAKIQSIAALVLASAAMSWGQQMLILNNGTQIQGRYDGGNSDHIAFIDQQGNTHRFNIAEIQNLIFNNGQPPAPPPPPPAAYNNYPPPPAPPQGAQNFADRTYQDADVPPPNGWNHAGTLPPGTEVVVSTIDRIDVRHADPRQHFLATVASDIRDSNGNVVIPRGSNAHLIAQEVGGGEIALDLRAVYVNGQRYVLNSEDMTGAHPREGLGANGRTGKFVGGSALLGGILGAVAGGGKGAAIGALAGGAAGATAEVLTRGPALKIPPETTLSFRLDQPVYLYH